MSNAATAVATAAVKLWPIIRKNWPKAMAAIGQIYKFIGDNPDLPKKLKDLLTGVPQRVADVQKRGDEADKILGTLNIVRDVAREASMNGSTAVDVDRSVAHANGIERGVRLAAALSRPAKKQALARLRSQTDELLAELIDAVASKPDTTPNPAGGQQAAG